MFGHVAVENSPPIMRNDEEAVQHAESQRRNVEEIHCGDGFTMILEKSCPALCWLRISRRFPHPTQHRSLGERRAKPACCRGASPCRKGSSESILTSSLAGDIARCHFEA